ncbi:cGMP-dependent protein kinase 1-like [Sycon ciliatum]|uniref:cGMP-dependent protein kinase 1-like n=1 Tax=Sycon ciliatum TaxID=27933 RepID=UPI0031F6BB45
MADAKNSDSAPQVNGAHSAEVDTLRQEIDILRQQLVQKDFVIDRLRKENNEIRSLLESMSKSQMTRETPSILLRREKLPAVSGEPSAAIEDKPRTKYPKTDQAKKLIREAILKNDFLKNLDPAQIDEMVDCMKKTKFAADQFVVREGWPGTELYVTAVGNVEVKQKNKVLRTLEPGSVFGELAILYNCTRTATVVTLGETEVWSLDRQTFKSIMMSTGQKRLDSYKQFLRKHSTLRGLPEDKLAKVADCLEQDEYNTGDYIIRQGGVGDTFFIIRSGTVDVTETQEGKVGETLIRTLEAGQTFGELALQGDSRRTANVRAKSHVTCLVLERSSFQTLIGDLNHYAGQRTAYDPEKKKDSTPIVGEFPDMKLDDLKIVGTLGVGGFGRVELVCLKSDKKQAFALKCLKKKHIVETRQQEHIFNEKRIMMEVRCPYIARLYRTFRDSRFLYLLVEACLGGELWTVLRNKSHFDDPTARFYIACVIEAFEYLHSQGIIYRDLKPENLLLDARGYVKLVDFGFAKRIGFGRKTWTFCGTPEYVPPEIILNKGHDFSADFWSLGILIFELLTGTPPFTGDDPMKTYNNILKGLDSIIFPRTFPKHPHNLIRKLCRDNPADRLGNQKEGIKGIKCHRWFTGFDWAGLPLQTVRPPIVPRVKTPTDLSNFDPFEPNTELPEEDRTGWDEGF